jgi:hypothetical protein
MKKIWLSIAGIVVLFLIVIQFFPPEKNDKLVNPQDDIVFHVTIPADVKKNLVNACYDCHSNRTVYPFYNKIAPVSWILARHIREGKEHLNFSEWTGYDKRTRIKLLTAVCDEITAGEMPLKGYVSMHSKAVLNEKQIEAICAWTEQAAEEEMEK